MLRCASRDRLSRCACAGLVLALMLPALPAAADKGERAFQRIATFPVFRNTSVDAETVAEIVAATADGRTLVYTDGKTGNIGFVDIADPRRPAPAGVVFIGGEPTSVAVAGRYALAVTNTSPSFTVPSGMLVVIDIEHRRIEAAFDLGGQPDSIAVSPDRRYAAIAIENERDEDLGDGRPPQSPGGFLTIMDLDGEPAHWRLRRVDLTGIPDSFPDDPEAEFVDINAANIAAVTLQENNHVALVHLPSGRILNDWSAGTVDLTGIDVAENDLIELTGTLAGLPREPDGIAWLGAGLLATADEGDLDGGGRGFTVFDADGNVRFTAGNALERMAVRLGHYPEDRSENKGNEPENVAFARYSDERFLFVGSERSGLVFVYRLGRDHRPELAQALPTGVKPEGLLAIPQRNLFVVAAEEDDRGDKIRSAISIYQLTDDAPTYPTVIAGDRPDGAPIPWGALSGLAVDHDEHDKAYTVHDSFYRKSRVYALDIGERPARITGEIVLRDALGRLAAVTPGLVNDDATVNLDLEGIAVRAEGGFWLASEGRGSVDDPRRPVASLNLLLRTAGDGTIEQVVTLPDVVNARQRRFGYEGVAAVGTGGGEQVYVAFQREWSGDPKGKVRIGRYDTASGAWAFFYYPLDAATSLAGGWVGLSELTALGGDAFAVVERDNQAGTDATVKRIYRFSLAGLTPQPDPGLGATPAFPVVTKTPVRDLLPDLEATSGAVLEKIEGLTVLPSGDALIVNDNDGVDDSNGETQLLRIDSLFGD